VQPSALWYVPGVTKELAVVSCPVSGVRMRRAHHSAVVLRTLAGTTA
jgi:hypothetical protein